MKQVTTLPTFLQVVTRNKRIIFRRYPNLSSCDIIINYAMNKVNTWMYVMFILTSKLSKWK